MTGAAFVCLLAFVTVAAGLLLSRRRVVADEVTIDAPPEIVVPFIRDLKTGWSTWNPLAASRQGVALQFEGPEGGAGATVRWKGKVGEGCLRIVEATDTVVRYHVETGTMTAHGELTLNPCTEGTTVTWSDDLELGKNPLARWLGLLMSGMRRKNLRAGLAQLKRSVEDAPRD